METLGCATKQSHLVVPCWTATQQPQGSDTSFGYSRLELLLKLKFIKFKKKLFFSGFKYKNCESIGFKL